jgi:flagellar basal-body rod protein FlgC
MKALASNLANVETTRTPEGGPYRRKDVVVSALPLHDDFASILKTELGESLQRALATGIIEDAAEPKKVFNPSHPDADPEGNVAMPNIDLVEEMVNLVTATRSFEANVTAINAAKSIALRAIELGR